MVLEGEPDGPGRRKRGGPAGRRNGLVSPIPLPIASNAAGAIDSALRAPDNGRPSAGLARGEPNHPGGTGGV